MIAISFSYIPLASIGDNWGIVGRFGEDLDGGGGYESTAIPSSLPLVKLKIASLCGSALERKHCSSLSGRSSVERAAARRETGSVADEDSIGGVPG